MSVKKTLVLCETAFIALLQSNRRRAARF